MGAAPPLSVVMPVHNAMPFLDEAVASILAQSFSDFEFVILDDGSTDGSTARLRHWAERDRRIRLIVSPERLGPVGSSNRVVAEAAAPLAARMDADDVAHPERLARQMKLMDELPAAVLCGTLYETIDGGGRLLREADMARLVRRSRFPPFSHPTILFRREAFARVGGYRSEAARWEDIDLYLRLAGCGRIVVLAESLMKIRLSGANSRLSADPFEIDAAMDAMYNLVTGEPPARSGKLRPIAFLPNASIRLWQGRRPRLTRRLLRHGALRADPATARMLIWAAWADLGPGSLRLFLRGLLSVRNAAARRRLGHAGWIDWQPPDLHGRSA